MAWREGGSPWNLGALRDGFRRHGNWFAEVKRAGRYRVTRCRVMKKTTPLLNTDSGAVKIGTNTVKRTLQPGDIECVLELDLVPGVFALQSILAKGDKLAKPRTWDANFAYVDFLKPAGKGTEDQLVCTCVDLVLVSSVTSFGQPRGGISGG